MKLTEKIKRTAGGLLPRMKPSAICIGAQKGGTTALYNYLQEHPEIATASTKEIDFFNCTARYEKGVKFYSSYFPRLTPANRRNVALDVTPGYLAAAETAAPRIRTYDRKSKIIALLREPGARAFSAWNMYRRLKVEDPDWFFKWKERCDAAAPDEIRQRSGTFGESFTADILEEIEAEEKGESIEMPILRLGRYADHLRKYTDLFPQEQLLVIRSEDMRADTLGTLRRVEDFLGVMSFEWNAEDLRPRFRGGYETGVGEEAGKILKEYYDCTLRELQEMFPRVAWEE